MPVRGAGLMAAEPTEAEALVRCAKGETDHAAFRVLYEIHRPEVEAFLVRLLGERASVEDALQDTFVRLHRSLKGFDTTRPLRPYVLAIARNVALDALRKRKKFETLEAAEVAAAPDRREASAAVEEALDALEAQHRSLIVMRWLYDLKQDDIAAALGCTARTVRNRLRTASALFERELVRRGILPRIEEEA